MGIDAKKNDDEKKPLESLLWGDDLGIITKYDFYTTQWHICQHKEYYKKDRDYLTCHKDNLKEKYDKMQWDHEALKDTAEQKGLLDL